MHFSRLFLSKAYFKVCFEVRKFVIGKPHYKYDIFVIIWGQGGAKAKVWITKISYECKWGLTGFYPNMGFIVLVYNSGNQKVLINDCYACLQVLSKQLYVWNAYLSLLDYNLVIAGL